MAPPMLRRRKCFLGLRRIFVPVSTATPLPPLQHWRVVPQQLLFCKLVLTILARHCPSVCSPPFPSPPPGWGFSSLGLDSPPPSLPSFPSGPSLPPSSFFFFPSPPVEQFRPTNPRHTHAHRRATTHREEGRGRNGGKRRGGAEVGILEPLHRPLKHNHPTITLYCWSIWRVGHNHPNNHPNNHPRARGSLPGDC